MDVEVLKKINSLAKTLHTQGLASNMDDATRLASAMVGTKHADLDGFSDLAKTQMSGHGFAESPERSTLASGQTVVSPPRTFAEVKHATINEQMMSGMESAVPAYSKPLNPPMQPITDEMNKIKFEIEGKVNNISSKVFEVENHSQNNFKFINQIGDEIDKINNRLNKIEKMLSESSRVSQNNSNNNSNSNNQNHVASETPQQQTQEKPREQANPRTGDAKPGEFDIRKYFYSGSDK